MGPVIKRLLDHIVFVLNYFRYFETTGRNSLCCSHLNDINSMLVGFPLFRLSGHHMRSVKRQRVPCDVSARYNYFSGEEWKASWGPVQIRCNPLNATSWLVSLSLLTSNKWVSDTKEKSHTIVRGNDFTDWNEREVLHIMMFHSST